MKNKSFTDFKNIHISFICAIIFVGALSFGLVGNYQNVRQEEKWVRYTNSVISNLDLMMSSFKDAETGTRGYLITGLSDHLPTYEKGMSETWKYFREVKKLTRRNPAQQALLRDIQEPIIQKNELFKSYIRDRNKYGRFVAPSEEANRRGTDLMDIIREKVETMKELELNFYNEQQERAENSHYFTLSSIIAFILLNIVLLGLAYWTIIRNLKAQALETEKQKRQAWLQTHLGKVALLMSADVSPEEMAHQTLTFFSSVLSVPSASVFLTQGSELALCASFGTDESRLQNTRFDINSSILGEAIKAKTLVEVKDVPENYLTVTSSLGKTAASSLVFVPLFFHGNAIGVLELALYSPLTQDQLELIRQSQEVIATGLNASISRQQLELLLTKTQDQAQELQTQQEELRATNEELEEQASQLEDQQRRLNLKNERLQASQKEIQAKAADLERINQYKSDFLARMSHELRTPLNSVLILATLLQENAEGNLNDQQKHFAETIHSAGSDLLMLINDILDLSKIEAQKLQLRPDHISLQSIFKQLESAFLPEAQRKGLTFTAAIDSALSGKVIFTDKLRLDQILKNFLSNAMKFTEQGEVKLQARASSLGDKYFEISVKDSGIGIPPDKKDKIFEAFEQIENTNSRRFSGTGLGLTIAKELTQILGGTITVLSTEGEGSEFILTLPFSADHLLKINSDVPALGTTANLTATNTSTTPAAELETPAQREEIKAALNAIQGQAKTLLLVEDDQVFRKLVAEAARGYSFATIEVENAEMAMTVLEQHVPTAIMLDIKLPGMSGMALLEKIKNKPQLRHVPVHMISALQYQQSAYKMGAMGYLGKPVTMEQVNVALREIEDVIARQSKSILLLEDDPHQREALTHLIGSGEVTIHAVATAQEALTILENQTFDCLVLDLSLPDMSGEKFLEKLKGLQIAHLPVIIYTGKEVSRTEEESLRRHSESIILKGVRSEERLLDEVNLFLHRVDGQLNNSQRTLLDSFRKREKSFEGKTVLIADDDIRNIFALTSALESKGFNVVSARNGVEALAKLEGDLAVDIILMDLMMPKMDGYETMRNIRRSYLYKNTPIIALTAKAMKGDNEKALEAGANDYLTKPLDLSNLFSVLKVWLPTEDLVL